MFGHIFKGGFTRENENWWGERIKLELSPYAYSKMVHYTQRARGEISGFGKIKKIGNRVIITNVKIFKQVCTSAHTSLDTEKLHIFMNELFRKGEDTGKWKLWWHSHNDFRVYWSGIDEANIVKHSDTSYLLSICINKNVDMVGRIDDKGETATIPVKVLPIRGRLKDRCYEETVKKVTYNRGIVSDFNMDVEEEVVDDTEIQEVEECSTQDNQELLSRIGFQD